MKTISIKIGKANHVETEFEEWTFDVSVSDGYVNAKLRLYTLKRFDGSDSMEVVKCYNIFYNDGTPLYIAVDKVPFPDSIISALHERIANQTRITI